ncbi:MAG: hypothetical protein FD143_469 [Ignavibacteria bacterium]|nr:MAG: hypothetical protein FD143_469 [Ignavibacteria bacterium]KAF0161540.1 MAG: hypothetical protein FD188_657 [Ignavibacteria bacterium]
MAVPPMGVKIIFEALLKSFAKIEYDSIDCNITPFIHRQHQVIYNVSSMKEQYTIFEKTENTYQKSACGIL